MPKKKKKKVKKEIINQGNLLTILSNLEVGQLIDKYGKGIKFACRRMNYIPGYDEDDLFQECIIKIVSGIYMFSSKKSKEKTWIFNIVRRTLDGIRTMSLKNKRACYVPSEDGEKPVYNYSMEYIPPNSFSGERLSLEEVYSGSPDNRPVFGTQPVCPEELCNVAQIVFYLKEHLSEEAYEYMKNKLFSNRSLQEITELESRFRAELQKEGLRIPKRNKELEIIRIFSGRNIKEMKAIREIAEVMIGTLGFTEEQISYREQTLELRI